MTSAHKCGVSVAWWGGHECHSALEHFSCNCNEGKMKAVWCIAMATDMFSWSRTCSVAYVTTTFLTDQLASILLLPSSCLKLLFFPLAATLLLLMSLSLDLSSRVSTISWRCRKRWILTSISNVCSSQIINCACAFSAHTQTHAISY